MLPQCRICGIDSVLRCPPGQADIRGALRPLGKIADELAVAILIVRHLSKTGGTNAIYRGGGSIGIIGAARSGLLIAKDPDDESGKVRVLVRSKGNNSAPPAALRYELEPVEEHDCARVRWLGESSLTAADLLAEPVNAQDRTEREEAGEIISILLSDAPASAKTVLAACRDAGISERTARSAKADLGVRSVKTAAKTWLWKLPCCASCIGTKCDGKCCDEGCKPSNTPTALQPCSLGPEQAVLMRESADLGQGCNPAEGTEAETASPGDPSLNGSS
jgi:hypothetical protein